MIGLARPRIDFRAAIDGGSVAVSAASIGSAAKAGVDCKNRRLVGMKTMVRISGQANSAKRDSHYAIAGHAAANESFMGAITVPLLQG